MKVALHIQDVTPEHEEPDPVPRYFVQSVERALGILELFSHSRPRLSAAEIQRLTGLGRATVYRYCQTLTDLGYLLKTSEYKYKPGIRAIMIGNSARESLTLADAAQPFLRAAWTRLGLRVNMGVLVGSEIVYIARLNLEELVSIRLQIGSRVPAYLLSLGKAIIAYLPVAESTATIDKITFEAVTPHTISSRIEFEAELATARQRGYATNRQELALGLWGVAAPVLDGLGYPIAAVNISVTHEIPEDELSRLGRIARQTADDIAKVVEGLKFELGIGL